MVEEILINRWSFKRFVKALNKRAVCVFEDCCETGLFTMKFHLLDCPCTDMNKIRGVRFLRASAYEHFIIVLKRV